MANKLKKHFPMLHDREELKKIIQKDEKLKLTLKEVLKNSKHFQMNIYIIPGKYSIAVYS